MTDEFEPRLGRIGDRARRGDQGFAKQLKKASARLGRKTVKVRFSGAGIGRGGASARSIEMRTQRLPRFRMRRVIVKTHVSRSPRGGGAGALKAHLGYLQRDGVERDGSGGQIYTRDGVVPDWSGDPQARNRSSLGLSVQRLIHVEAGHLASKVLRQQRAQRQRFGIGVYPDRDC